MLNNHPPDDGQDGVKPGIFSHRKTVVTLILITFFACTSFMLDGSLTAREFVIMIMSGLAVEFSADLIRTFNR